ncbi:isochorismatase family protein [Chromobacterium haemolyticum]|nr:isochorismatase family protein [Chromobacterium haemolyticum]
MKTALLIIDVQSGMFDHEPRADQADAVIARLNQLAAAARAAGTPVVWVQHERASAPLTHGSAEWRLARGLDAQPDDHYLRKTTPDSFLRTCLHEQLQQWGVGQLVIAGYASEFCIDTTTRSAAAHGYAIILVSDAHTHPR